MCHHCLVKDSNLEDAPTFCLSALKHVESPHQSTLFTFHIELKQRSFIEKNANIGLNMLFSEHLKVSGTPSRGRPSIGV